MTHRRSGQRASSTQINDSCQAASIDTANYITLLSELLHRVDRLKIVSITTCKLRRMSWIRNGEDVVQNIFKTSGWILLL